MHRKKSSRKNDDKVDKTFFKLINNAVCGKTMENLRNRVDARLVNNKKDYFKWTSKSSFVIQKKLTLTLTTIW